MSEIIQPNQLVEIDARNPRPGFKRLKAGDIFLWNLELLEDDWNRLRTIPDNALLTIILKWSDGDPEPEQAASKPESGPHSGYWRRMFRQGFQNSRDLWQVLGVDSVGAAKEQLHAEFEVDSLSNVSPETFEGWCDAHNLHQTITQSRTAQGAER